jgi:hypothetical protein
MIAMLWRKYWMELNGIWAWNAIFAILPAIAFAPLTEHRSGPVGPLVQHFIYAFAFVALAMFPAPFAGTGLATFTGSRAPRGPDLSLLFTLSLPARRRTLFFYRAGFCLMAIESLVILGLEVAVGMFARVGGSRQVFDHGLWILFLMIPIYFLDCLLSIRFDAVRIMQVQILCVGWLWFVLHHSGVTPERVAAVLSGIAPIPFVLLTLFVSAGLAVTTVWRLDRRDY